MDGERTVKKLLEGKPGGNKRRNTRLRWHDDVESDVKEEEKSFFFVDRYRDKLTLRICQNSVTTGYTRSTAIARAILSIHKWPLLFDLPSYLCIQSTNFEVWSHKYFCEIKGQIEVTRRRGRRCKKLLDDLKDKRGYSQLKEEALDRTMWRNRFGRGFGPVVWQITAGDDDVFIIVNITFSFPCQMALYQHFRWICLPLPSGRQESTKFLQNTNDVTISLAH